MSFIHQLQEVSASSDLKWSIARNNQTLVAMGVRAWKIIFIESFYMSLFLSAIFIFNLNETLIIFSLIDLSVNLTIILSALSSMNASSNLIMPKLQFPITRGNICFLYATFSCNEIYCKKMCFAVLCWAIHFLFRVERGV